MKEAERLLGKERLDAIIEEENMKLVSEDAPGPAPASALEKSTCTSTGTSSRTRTSVEPAQAPAPTPPNTPIKMRVNKVTRN